MGDSPTFNVAALYGAVTFVWRLGKALYPIVRSLVLGALSSLLYFIHVDGSLQLARGTKNVLKMNLYYFSRLCGAEHILVISHFVCNMGPIVVNAWTYYGAICMHVQYIFG